jgi:hypothetical protein
MNTPSMGEIIPILAETHRVYALEFQGHGCTTGRHTRRAGHLRSGARAHVRSVAGAVRLALQQLTARVDRLDDRRNNPVG